MTPHSIETLLQNVAQGRISVAHALESLRDLPFEDLGFAKIDHHRALRQGFPEVVYGEGKTPEQVAQIAEKLAQSGASVLVTRTNRAAFEATRKRLPAIRFVDSARLLILQNNPPILAGSVGVLAAGTSDLPVAEEAALSLEVMGAQVTRIYDVGVAGLHRLLAQIGEIQKMRALIVVAGMEGALPSVVGGLVSVPVVAVPTSIGYGAAFGGLAALLGMLNTCASGVAVVNIDNGFGAAAFVASVLRSQT